MLTGRNEHVYLNIHMHAHTSMPGMWIVVCYHHITSYLPW